MPTRKRAILRYSPASGRAAHLPQARQALDACGIDIIQAIEVHDRSQHTAQNWLEQGIEIVIAAGGDGVIGSVINQIAGSSLPLGIMPLGTSNDIARSLNIPLDLRGAASVIAGGQIRKIDLGCASPLALSADQPPESPVVYGYFAHVLTVGLNVTFAQIATNVATRKRYGRLTYPVAALEALRNPEVLPVHLQFEGLRLPPYPAGRHPEHAEGQIEASSPSLSCRALQVSIVNAPIFGGAWHLSLPGSSMEDDELDIVIFEKFGPSQLNARLATLFNSPPPDITRFPAHDGTSNFLHHPAELTSLPGLHHLQARGVTLSTDQDPQPVTLDGEIRGQTPLHITLAKQFLPVLARPD
jgi:diacylglycerol kinase family enzyme